MTEATPPQCGATKHRCVCMKTPGHEDPHECLCYGSWSDDGTVGTIPDPNWRYRRVAEYMNQLATLYRTSGHES